MARCVCSISTVPVRGAEITPDPQMNVPLGLPLGTTRKNQRRKGTKVLMRHRIPADGGKPVLMSLVNFLDALAVHASKAQQAAIVS